MITIGVLALQGSVAEHIHSLSKLDGINPCEVRTKSELDKVDGLILPGGESTTIGKLLKDFDLTDHIIDRINSGMPVWGTCAGMILLAKEIVDENFFHLGLMDISVRRNAFGSQLDSFSTNVFIPEISKDELPLVFIRAPWVENAGNNVRILCKVNNKISAVRQKNMLATAFHPELTENLAFHLYFAGMVLNHLKN